METQVIGDNKIGAGRQNAGKSANLLQDGENIQGYVIEKLLSDAGGEAEVYLCEKDAKRYVLKYWYSGRPNMEALTKLKSFGHDNPNIVTYYDYGDYKDHFFAILEYAVGGALDDKTAGGKYKYIPVSEEDALQITKEAVDAFDACHKAGIIHRDIKPGNLFYKNAEILKGGVFKGSGILIGDFGIASIFEADQGLSKHMTETTARTEGYAAPEAYSGVIGPELDYYSLGVTLWVLLTGEEPFTGKHEAEIIQDTIQGKTADLLLARSPKISALMKQLIRGLLTVRHDKRWKRDEVLRHLAGEKVEIFEERETLPIVEIGGDKCLSYREIAEAILKHREEGKDFVFGKLVKYLNKVNPKLADDCSVVIETYSAEKREYEGAVFVAFKLFPQIAFPLNHGISISPEPGKPLSLQAIFNILETDPEAIMPYLRDIQEGFYIYLEAHGLGEHGKKVREIVDKTSGNIRAVSRIVSKFQGDVIKPFQDGVNNNYELKELKDLSYLPEHLKARTLIFIERNYGLLPAWIENVSGLNIDDWLASVEDQKGFITKLGKWKYFTLFLEGKDLSTFLDSVVREKDTDAAYYAASCFRKRGRYQAANILIDKFWSDVFYKGDWVKAGAFLDLIEKGHTEGLSNKFDFYYSAACFIKWEKEKDLKDLKEGCAKNISFCDTDGDPYILRLGIEIMRSGDYTGALDNFDKAIIAKKDAVLPQVFKAACLLNARKCPETTAICNGIIQSPSMMNQLSNNVKARVFRIYALACRGMGDIPNSERFLSQAKGLRGGN
jgi:serine/threonine protein kinase